MRTPCSTRRTRLRLRPGGAVCALGLALAGCVGDPLVPVEARAPGDTPALHGGPRVVWNAGARPFPDIPVPNDVATWPDPTSPTGLRINAAFVAPTEFESAVRRQFGELDGWGTFMPLSVSFTDDLDLASIAERHPRNGYDFRDDALYLVDLATGIPVPIDVGQGNFPQTLPNPYGIFPNDPRAGGSNYLLSTTNEDRNGDGVLQVDEDTNFDGELQRASVFPASARPEDALTTHWDAESRTLIVRPIVPLEERHTYAVVLTDRLRGLDGGFVRSPFESVTHPSQLDAIDRLRAHLSNSELSSRFYGDLRVGENPGGARVTFAWTFTTQTTVRDLEDVREGLYSRGRLAVLGRVDPSFDLFTARGGANCAPGVERTPYIVSGRELQEIIRMLVPALGFNGAQADALVASYDWVDYVAIGHYRTPYLAGPRENAAPDAHWHLDAVARASDASELSSEDVQVWFYVPKTTSAYRPPFSVALNAHGYGVGAVQTIAFAGYFARQGIATVGINAPTHGLPLTPSQTSAVRTLLRGQCMAPFANAFVASRARDLNGDTVPDSGGDFLTAQVFKTRDMFRQTALDYMLLSRIMSEPSWARAGRVDRNSDGTADAPGDFNGDGIVDVGGQRDGRTVPFYLWGESLGGITSMTLGALDPNVTATVPVSGGAGLTDVSVRTAITGVTGAVLGPTVGPIIVGVAATQRGPQSGRTRTSCRESETSLRWVVPDAAGIGELEFACAATMRDGATGAEPTLVVGDDVVAFNHSTQSERCARVPADGRLFLPVAADQGDRITLTVLAGHPITNYATCARESDAPVRATIRQFSVGEGDCNDGCGHVPPNAPDGAPARTSGVRRGTTLFAPAAGLGLRRQTSALRRFLQLAQMAIDAADPASFAPLYFARTRGAAPRPMLTMTTVGDTLVATASGNAFARAAGLIPFLSEPTGTTLDDYVTAPSYASRYGGATPNTVLIEKHVLEGLARLERHPVMSGSRYLFDVDDFDEGRQRFGEEVLRPPLRLVRAARSVAPSGVVGDRDAAADAIAQLWSPSSGEPLAGFANAYVSPTGTHTFYPSNPSEDFDIGNYLTNLTIRYFEQAGAELPYYSEPLNHHCLEDASCRWFAPRPTTP